MDGVYESHLFSTNINFNFILDLIWKHYLFKWIRFIPCFLPLYRKPVLKRLVAIAVTNKIVSVIFKVRRISLETSVKHAVILKYPLCIVQHQRVLPTWLKVTWDKSVRLKYKITTYYYNLIDNTATSNQFYTYVRKLFAPKL